MTRATLLALPLPELHALAHPILRASAERYGWRAVRPEGLPRWLLCEIVLTGRARVEAEREVG